MTLNKLSVNPHKTEYLLFNPNNVNLPVNIINFGSNTISPSDSAKNLGPIFQTDSPWIYTSHLLLNIASFNSVICVAFFHLFLKLVLSHLLMLLFIPVKILVIESFMTFLNILVIACKKYKIQLLASLQILFIFRTYIAPTLKSLHWLLIFYRINFKICSITHRSCFKRTILFKHFADSSVKYSFAPCYFIKPSFITLFQ